MEVNLKEKILIKSFYHLLLTKWIIFGQIFQLIIKPQIKNISKNLAMIYLINYLIQSRLIIILKNYLKMKLI